MSDNGGNGGLPNGDSSRVTTFQLYREITELRRDTEANYAQLRGEIRSLHQTVTGKGGIEEVASDHESRMRSVERWKNALPVATLLFMATTALGAFALFVR